MYEPVVVGSGADVLSCVCPVEGGIGGRCLAGTYCPEGSPAPVVCNPGMACTLHGDKSNVN